MERTDQPRTPTMSPADVAAHKSASYVRPNPAAADYRALTTAWTDDDNKPVIPRIPGPRKPSVTLATRPLPRQAVASA